MSFVSRCPYCKNAYRGEEAEIGQVTSCANCGKQFIIQHDEDNTQPETETKFVSRCPYCGSTYQAEEAEIGQVTSCANCGKQFIIQHDDTASASGTPPTLTPERTFTAKCPFCGKIHEFNESMLGQAVTCGNCQRAFVAQKETVTTVHPVAVDTSLRQKLQSAYQTYFGFSIVFLAATASFIYFAFGHMFGGVQHIATESGRDSMISVYFVGLVFTLMQQGLNSIVIPHCWEQIKAHRQIPANAVTFMFVPVLNCYWNFVAFGEMGNFLSGVTGNQTPQKLAKAYSTVFIIFCLYPFPLLYPVLTVLGMFMMTSFCNAIKRWQNWA